MPNIEVDVYRVEPTGYADMVADDKDRWCLYVVNGHSEYGWSVRFGYPTSTRILNRRGELRFDDRRYLRHWRYPVEEALALAEKHVDTVRMNGRTASEANEWLIARLADLEAQRADSAPTTAGE